MIHVETMAARTSRLLSSSKSNEAHCTYAGVFEGAFGLLTFVAIFQTEVRVPSNPDLLAATAATADFRTRVNTKETLHIDHQSTAVCKPCLLRKTRG